MASLRRTPVSAQFVQVVNVGLGSDHVVAGQLYDPVLVRRCSACHVCDPICPAGQAAPAVTHWVSACGNGAGQAAQVVLVCVQAFHAPVPVQEKLRCLPIAPNWPAGHPTLRVSGAGHGVQVLLVVVQLPAVGEPAHAS